MVPTGYSFNLDGTSIYMTLATLFIAQALGVDLTLNQQLTIFAVAMLTSKGAGSFTGADSSCGGDEAACRQSGAGAGHGGIISRSTAS